MTYSVFINDKGKLEIEEYSKFENEYYIYNSSSIENCKEFCRLHNDKFHNYMEWFEFLETWCNEQNTDFSYSQIKYKSWFDDKI